MSEKDKATHGSATEGYLFPLRGAFGSPKKLRKGDALIILFIVLGVIDLLYLSNIYIALGFFFIAIIIRFIQPKPNITLPVKDESIK